jgi:hypothetical protein
MNKRLLLVLLASFFVVNLYADPVPPARNKDGSLVSGILEAEFDPINAKIPFPSNLLFPTAPPIDLTIQIPGLPDPDDYTSPSVALSSLDGFSTTEKWITNFTQNLGGPSSAPILRPGDIDPTSVVPGKSVRVFEVTSPSYPWLAVTGVVRELTPVAEFVAVAPGNGVLAIVPTAPLKQYTTYMAVLTNDIRDINGNDATPSSIYGLTKSRTPWVDENGNSTYSLLPDSTARALEPLRQITMSMELSAAAAGVNPDDIVLSWTVHTQSISPVLQAMRKFAQPADTIIAPSGLNTSAVGGFGLADIYIGVITVPYYSGIPSSENPTAPLTEFWKASPGAYIPPFDQIPFLDPTSTNLTVANPFPVPTGMQTVPLLVTVPNEDSGFTKPENGWPVVLFMHGLTRNRTDMLAIADTIARTGRVAVTMDLPLHGVVPDVEPQLAPFYIENTPFAPIANERTFDVDYWNAAEGTLGPDGLGDQSGLWNFFPGNLQGTRDHLRQGEVDFSVLALSLQNMSVDGDATPDLNAFDVSLVTQSVGGYFGVPVAAVEPILSRLYLNVTGGGVVRSLDGGFFGPNFLQPFLKALADLEPGTADYEQFLLVAQTLMDSGDGINWGALAASKMPVIHNQILEDEVVPNVVPGAPLAGSEALNRVLGLSSYSTTQANPDGIKGVARFLQPAPHSSLLLPTVPTVTAEMQGQMASFIASGGTFVQVGNPDLLLPVAPPAPAESNNSEKSESGNADKNRPGLKPADAANN